jgi:hypothetical protein
LNTENKENDLIKLSGKFFDCNGSEIKNGDLIRREIVDGKLRTIKCPKGWDGHGIFYAPQTEEKRTP